MTSNSISEASLNLLKVEAARLLGVSINQLYVDFSQKTLKVGTPINLIPFKKVSYLLGVTPLFKTAVQGVITLSMSLSNHYSGSVSLSTTGFREPLASLFFDEISVITPTPQSADVDLVCSFLEFRTL